MPTTTNLSLELPTFNASTWHDDVNTNFQLLDAAYGALSIQGEWLNSTAYSIGDRVVDVSTSTVYVCEVGHTSAASPTTFASDRSSNPTYWVSLPALQQFLQLTDNDETSYTGEAGNVVRVNVGEDGIEFFDITNLTAIEALTPTKGNILAGNGTAWVARGVGSNNQVLTADSAEADGVKWAAAQGDLLAANNLSDVSNAGGAFSNIKQFATATSTGVIQLPVGYIQGFAHKTNTTDATNDIDIFGVGSALDTTGAAVLVGGGSTFVKQLDATWATGTAAGGNFEASPSDAWWYIFVIGNGDNAVDYGFSTSADPTADINYPTGTHPYYRCIGAVRRISSANISYRSNGDTHLFTTRQVIRNSTAAATNTALATVTPGAEHCQAIISNRLQSSTVSGGQTLVYVADGNQSTAGTNYINWCYTQSTSEINRNQNGGVLVPVKASDSSIRFTASNSTGAPGVNTTEQEGFVMARANIL